MIGMYLRMFVIAIALSASTPLSAETYYIAVTGNDSSGNGSISQPYRTLTAAFLARGGGHTYVLRDGTYDYSGTEITTPPSGTAAAYTVIKAENEGAVVLRRALSLASSVSYIRFEGLRWDYPGEKIILGHHHKFFRCSFRGGPTSGNVKNTRVGQDNSVASYVLFEDCWFWGPGGRYNIAVFNSHHVVLRRCVIRHDEGWTGDGSNNPEAGVVFYNSYHVAAQNVIVLDSLGVYKNWDRAFFLVRNPNSAGFGVNNVSYRGCIALATHGLGLAMDTDMQTISDVIVDNCVFWDTRNGGIGMNEGNKVRVTITNVTVGSSLLTHQASAGGISYWNGGPDTPTVKNVIVKGKRKPFYALAPAWFDCHGNQEPCPSGTGAQTYDPLTNGLSDLRRIESGRRLATDGENGGRIGAQIMTRVGTSGTLYGEPGWESDTGQALWPWPQEARIKSEMCAGRSDGFCGAASLTAYICGYLGSPCTTDTQAPTVPANVSAAAESSNRIRISWTASTDNVGVAGYRLDVSTSPTFASYVSGYQNKDAGGVTTTAVTGLSANTTYYARVRAYDAAANVSGHSATAQATTHVSSGDTTTRVIEVGDVWRYFKGSVAPPPLWSSAVFDDSSWPGGPTGIGYGDGDDATVLADMQNNYWSVYARRTFRIDNPAGVTGLTLTIDYDDGYVAYLNGTEVARGNMPAGTPSHDTAASPWREAGTPVVVDLTAYAGLLVAGQNVLAVEVHNDDIASSDLSMIPALDVRSNSDVFAPSAPASVSASSSSETGMTVSWDPSSDNVAVTGYRLDVSTSSTFATFVSGYQNRDVGNVTSVNVTGLSPATTYYARVRACDAAGNVSANSAAASATTRSEGPTTVRVIAVGDTWRYLKGTAAPPAGWNLITFNDGAWLSGPTGIGYGDADDATVIPDMQNNYWSVYTRKTFTVDDPAAVAGLTLTIDYDDGYVAYLNGTEVARANMPAGTPTYNTAATPFHEAGTPVTVDLSSFRHLLVAGQNVLAIEIHNDSIDSSDLSLIPSLDLRIPVRVIAVGAVWKYFKGTTAPPLQWNTNAFDDSAWLSGPTGIGYGDADDATVLADMQNNYVSVYARRAFTLSNAAAVTRLTMTIDWDDGYVAYLNGAEVARSNMATGVPQHTTVASSFHEAGTPVTVNLTPYLHLLVTGRNTLAIQVHNDSIDSSDLSMIPALDIER